MLTNLNVEEKILELVNIRERDRVATTPLHFMNWGGGVDYKPILKAMKELAKNGELAQKGRDLDEGTCFVIPDKKFVSIKRGNGDNSGKRSSP